jgi:hypothetical protein
MRPRPEPTASLLLLLTFTACGDDDPAQPSTSSTSSTSSTTTLAATSTATVDPTSSSTDTGEPSSSTTTAPHTTGTESDTGSTAPAATDSASSSDTSTSTGGSTDTGDSTETSSESSTSTDTGIAPGSEFDVLQLNLCHSGVAGCFTGDDVMTKAVSVINNVAPELVTLNEMCREDLPWLAAQTGALDHRFTPALKADGSPVKCVNGDDYGNGLLSWFVPAWPEPATGVYAAQSSTTERRVWICMGYEGFTGCTTHLSTAGATALAQCHDLVDGPLVTAAAAGPAVMAGDWNLKYNGDPDAQDCVPDSGFYRKGDGSVQHVLASDDFGFIETVVIDMDGTTDHPGLRVRLTYP